MAFREEPIVCLPEVSPDYEIAHSVVPINVAKMVKGLDIHDDHVDYYGKYKAKLKAEALLRARQGQPNGRYVVVTATTPTPFGEGKTTISIGLSQGLGRHLGLRNILTLRQPSAGPTFGVKGGAAGGGYSQVIPMEDMNLHLTGDTHAVSLATNLIASAVDSRIFHESTQTDESLARRMCPVDPQTGTMKLNAPQKRRLHRLGLPFDDSSRVEDLSKQHLRSLVRLDIDASAVMIRRVVDINDRALREIALQGFGKGEGHNRVAAFDVSAAAELMVVLAMAEGLKDLQQRVRRIVVAYDKTGQVVTVDDLCCAGAVVAILKDALHPTLIQTLEGTPALVHAGPFANIAHGNSSVIADKLALKLVGEGGFVITECGFAADMGFEKFCDIKCRSSGLVPDCVVIVTTVRALKYHGGAPPIAVGGKVPDEYKGGNGGDALISGCSNLQRHIENCRKFGVDVIVAVNKWKTDTDAEISLVNEKALAADAYRSVGSTCFAEGGRGSVELAAAVVELCSGSRSLPFEPLYPLHLPLKDKIAIICKSIYRAGDVCYSAEAQSQIERLERCGFGKLPICMAKTQYSLSHDPTLYGAPSGFVVPVVEVRLAAGAGFVFPLCGAIMTMPGLTTRPAFYDIEVDCETGVILGLS